MPVKHCKVASRLLFCGLLPVMNVQADGLPSMAFLEYLGGVENEVDGQLSSPVELDLEAALVAGSGKRIEDEVKADGDSSSEHGNEENINE
jgi:hypothetical protein